MNKSPMFTPVTFELYFSIALPTTLGSRKVLWRLMLPKQQHWVQQVLPITTVSFEYLFFWNWLQTRVANKPTKSRHSWYPPGSSSKQTKYCYLNTHHYNVKLNAHEMLQLQSTIHTFTNELCTTKSWFKISVDKWRSILFTLRSSDIKGSISFSRGTNRVDISKDGKLTLRTGISSNWAWNQ